MHGLESDFILNPSGLNVPPTEEEPDNKYIFTSIYFGQGKDLVTINRKTYSMLDWLGDWGGLLDGLRLVARFLVSPFSALALRARLVETFARVKTVQDDPSDRSN